MGELLISTMYQLQWSNGVHSLNNHALLGWFEKQEHI